MDAPAPAPVPVPAWDLVVKVKYGDTLRRFNVSVHGRDFDHDMNKLRTKIINFFKFNANANMILTYIDEDGDAVTLVDDDELRDAVFRQHLNPLRINVQLNTDFAARAEARPHLEASNIAPKTGTQGIQASHLSSIDDALQSVPDPLRGVLSKISHDFMSKAAASAPALAEFVEYFSKLGQTPTSTESNTLNNADFGRASASEPNAVDLNMGDRPKPLHEPKSSKKPATTNTTEGMSMSAPDSLVDVNLEIPDLSFLKESVSSALAKGKSESKKVASGLPDGKSIATTPVPAVDKPVHHQSQNNVISVPPPVAYPPGITDFLYGDGKGIPCSTSPSVPQFGFNHQNSLPINKHTGAPAPNQIPTSGLSQVFSPYRKARESRGLYDSMLRTFHRGVRCDGCGMHPIMGPRFKSNVKDDYDLCSICFSEMGNEADYTRIDRAPYRPPRFLKEFNNPLQHSRFHGPHGCRGYGLRSCKGKLESRFIQDVTVLDGTLMAPSTPFTKIWRMRNNGTIAWPSGTQLVWIGGDQFAERVSVNLEISENGFPVDEEIDIAVDFRAPSRPGRYISYWRMASPFGQKFGQRVWVLVQVDNSRPNSANVAIHPELNLNLPPEATEQNGLVIIDMNAEPVETVVQSVADILDANLDLVKPLANEIPLQSNMSTHVLDACGGLSHLSDMASSSSYPMIDLSSQPSPACSEDAVPLPQPGEASIGQASTDDDPVEQTLLKELEEMGFKQIDLNKEVLRLNDYDLEQSLNDLCGISEWDPILEELEEMGFCDKERNKKLLIKNGGSIKRAVLDLIAGEKSG
uniref:Uncharacterized protein C6orf106 n=1 Tax=Anthurium amnicola TaxID=1678845 RepID=A0A1D1Y246_9ARAE